jgi:hypothetical protein
MARIGLCGPSYTLQNVSADAQLTRNWYPEVDESQEGKSSILLLPTPGLSIFGQSLADGPCRAGLFRTNNRVFTVLGSRLFEVNQNGTLTPLGTVVNDQKPVSICASPLQLLLASGGQCYYFTFATNTFSNFPPGTFLGPVSQVGFCDGFFIALIASSNRFQISALEDVTIWDPTAATTISVFSDAVIGMIIDHRQIWFYGPHESQVYYNSGAAFFPFVPAPGGFVEQGLAAINSSVQLDNSVFWMGSQDKGNGIFWRANGYTPGRVSNFATETAWATYPTIEDCISYSYVDQGHSFIVLYFPTAKKTWVYDVAMNMWHERDRWDSVSGLSIAHPSNCHTFNWGKHLVGDPYSGTIYQMSITIPTDNGGPIRRVRRAPYISSEQQWILHHYMQLDLETGLGSIPPLLDGFGNARDPQITLRWSDDGAHTWSTEHTRGAGQAGKYKVRVIYRRLGKSRARVYEVSATDPVPWRLTDAYLKATPGFDDPTERVVKQYQKVT